jgi:ABC-type protease/lipase transport system fused ATPase/permease subunit
MFFLQEVTRGVGFWLFMTILAFLVHLAWIPIPFLFHWSMEFMVVLVTIIGLVALFIFYFIFVVSNYRQRVRARETDIRSKRRLI